MKSLDSSGQEIRLHHSNYRKRYDPHRMLKGWKSCIKVVLWNLNVQYFEMITFIFLEGWKLYIILVCCCFIIGMINDSIWPELSSEMTGWVFISQLSIGKTNHQPFIIPRRWKHILMNSNSQYQYPCDLLLLIQGLYLEWDDYVDEGYWQHWTLSR